MEFAHAKSGDVTVVSPTGRIDSLTAPDFEGRVRGLLDAGERRVVVDLGTVTFVSTAGLRALLLIARALETAHGKLALCGLSRDLERLFELSQFNTLLRILGTREAAVAAVG